MLAVNSLPPETASAEETRGAVRLNKKEKKEPRVDLTKRKHKRKPKEYLQSEGPPEFYAKLELCVRDRESVCEERLERGRRYAEGE